MWNSRIKDENWNKFAESNKIDDGKKAYQPNLLCSYHQRQQYRAVMVASGGDNSIKKPSRARTKKNILECKCHLFSRFSSL